MKKIAALLLALAMMLGCVAFAEGVDYVGTWVLTGVEEEGMQMGPEMLTMFGMSMVLGVNADGTVTMSMMGEEDAGTWAVTENGIAITDEIETVELVYQDEILVMNQESTLLMFTREGAAPAVASAAEAAVLAGVDPAAFEGQWLLTTANVFGMDMPAEEMGVYMALVLSQGSALFATQEGTGELATEELSYTVAEVEGVGTVCTVHGKDEATGEVVEVLALNLLDDGRLVWTMDLEGLLIKYFFTAQTAE